MKSYLFVLLLLFSIPSIANEYLPINGKYRLAGKIAFGDIEPGNSHLYIKITGESAKKLYAAINAREDKEGCTPTASKTAGNIVCHKHSNSFPGYCIFAVSIDENKIELGETC